jgi:hypothetical protein
LEEVTPGIEINPDKEPPVIEFLAVFTFPIPVSIMWLPSPLEYPKKLKENPT